MEKGNERVEATGTEVWPGDHHFLAVLLILLPADLRSSPMPFTVPQPAKNKAVTTVAKNILIGALGQSTYLKTYTRHDLVRPMR